MRISTDIGDRAFSFIVGGGKTKPTWDDNAPALVRPPLAGDPALSAKATFVHNGTLMGHRYGTKELYGRS